MGVRRFRVLLVAAGAVALLPFGSGARAAAAAGAGAAAPAGAAAHPAAAARKLPGLAHPGPLRQGAAPYSGPLAGASMAVPGKSPAAGPAPGAQQVPAADAAAEARARATGAPVAVPSLTSETSEVLAQPDGEFEMVSSTLPSRVKTGGAWRNISTTLRRDQAGTWSAPLTAAPVTFSGGGSGPLVTVTDPASGGQVSLSWPYPVPSPSVSGDTARYANALPGVDLRLTATSTGYGEVLVVHDAAAAADPRLRSLAFTLRGGPGVTVSDGADGTVTAVDSATGRTLFTSGQPMMWDSAPARHLAAPASASAAGNGAVFSVPSSRAARAAGGRSQVRVTMTPFSTARTSPGRLRFPLYIDPQINDSSAQYYSEVANFGRTWNTTTNTTSVGSGVVEAGYCGYSNCAYTWNGTTYPSYVVRDYFQMNTSDLQERDGEYPTVYKADFYPDEVGNSDGCTAQDVALYSATGTISSSTSWPGPQGSQIATASSAAGGSTSGCPAASVDLDVTSYVQSQAGSGPKDLTFELRAPDETNDLQYKTFTDNPTLTVWYNFAPLAPTGVSVGKQVTCTSLAYTSDAAPVISATGVDANPSPLQLDFTYALDTQSATLVKKATQTNGGGGYTSGSTVTWTAPALTSGDEYEVDVQTSNVVTSGDGGIVSSLTSPWSGNYHFTVLSAAPSAEPAIRSFDYPDNQGQAQWGQPAGAPGVFTVGTNGDANIAGFAYSFDSQGNEPVPNTSDCSYLSDGGLGTSMASDGTGNASGELALVSGSTAQILVPSTLQPGRHTLFVRSFDYAHNASPEAAYPFYVAPNYQQTSQPVTYTDGSSLASSASGANASLVTTQANCCNLTFQGGSQLWFKATASGQAFTVSFNVPDAGTWQLGAELTRASDYGTAQIVLDAGTSSAAYLGGTLNAPFDAYSPTATLGYLDLGTPQLTAGAHTLTFTITGEDASSAGYYLGLDFLTLSPTSRYEADSLPYGNATDGGTAQQQCFAEAAWEDNCQLFFSNTAAGASFTVSFDAPVQSDYALGVNLTTATDYGEVAFTLDPGTTRQVALDGGASIDAYTPSISSEYEFLGGVHLAAGTHVLEVTVTGHDASATGNLYNAGLNFLQVAPVTGAVDSSFTAAMNNRGIVSDSGALPTGDNFDLTNTTGGDNMSEQALAAAGITPGSASGPGSTFSLDGAVFTMPQWRVSASGSVLADNVIPDGQTIPLPQVPSTEMVTGVALLVASTCGTSPAANATVGYGTGSRAGNGAIPAIPDWLAGTPASAAVMRLGHYDSGVTPSTAHRVRLFEVMLPSDPFEVPTSVTLPVMSANFLPDSGSCTASNALHVLALGMRAEPVPAAAGYVWTGAYDGPMDTAVTENPGLSDETLRETVPLSADGSGQVRVRLSNAHADNPVTFGEVTVAAAAASGTGATVAAPVAVTFGSGGSQSITIPAGGDAYSNPVALPSVSGGSGELTVSLYLPVPASSSLPVTLAPVRESPPLTTLYAAGNDTASTGSGFTAASSMPGQYYLSGVDVSDATQADGTIAVLGDQGAVGTASGNWVSDLPSAFSASGTAVPGSFVGASTGDAMPAGWWQLNGLPLDTSSTAYDSGTTGTNSLTLEGGPTWAADNPGTGASAGSLTLNGSGQYAQAPGPVVTGTGSFTVSAWVKLSSLPSGSMVAVSQDGTTNSSFHLGYRSGDWAFWFSTTDTTSTAQTAVTGPAATAGSWTMLTGVYDASAQEIELYVNGSLAASASYTQSWSAGGDFAVGRSLYKGSDNNYWNGSVSDVRAYGSALPAAGVSGIYQDTGQGCVTVAAAAGALSWSAFDDYAAGEPGLRDVIVSLGANDILRGAAAATVESNLSALIADIQRWYDTHAAAGSPLEGTQVFVTTIPPLGLPASDPREKAREAVNSWLPAGTQAAGVLDIAGAVADSSSANLVSSGYLTGGAPNSAYYQAIASAVAGQFTAWGSAVPPGPSL